MVVPAAVSLTYGDISRKVFLFELKIFETAKPVQVFSAVLEEHKMRDLLLLKETVHFAGAKHVPAAPVPSSVLLHLKVAHIVQGSVLSSGPDLTHSGNELPGGSGCAGSVPFPSPWAGKGGSATLAVVGVGSLSWGNAVPAATLLTARGTRLQLRPEQ